MPLATLVDVFQFHKGTIKTKYFTDEKITYYYFNSIKVQLKLNRFNYLPWLCQFQFHKGTIKTFQMTEVIPVNIYFNSIKVQLKQQKR